MLRKGRIMVKQTILILKKFFNESNWTRMKELNSKRSRKI